MAVNLKKTEIVMFTRSIYNLFISFCEKRRIHYEFRTNRQSFNCLFDIDMLDKILFNLLSNALKNTPNEGEIVIDLDFKQPGKNQDNWLMKITISNTGSGISPEHLDKIFDRFYQVPDRKYGSDTGSGIGLSIVKEYVELLDGNIEVNSIQNVKTDFILTFPLKEKENEEDTESISLTTRYKDTDLNPGCDLAPETHNIINEQKRQETDKKILLIVEDNMELRQVLGELFLDEFQVIEAENGKTGFEKATKTIPDIIISDVMMPEMDGIELCTICKNNDLTSHIPVILLTARADIQSRISGIESGADMYISKPFNHNLLKSHVNNLLRNREKLKIKYAGLNNQMSINMSSTNSSDISFVGKINNIIDQNIENENLSVNMLAEELKMSERQIYRKFKGMIDTTPGDYIRTFRLNKGASLLLRNEELSISEIAYSIGFKHPPSFTAAFKKYFGVSPTDYIQNNDT